jgi:hypothetical protein
VKNVEKKYSMTEASVLTVAQTLTYVDYFTYYNQDATNAFAFWLIAGFALGVAVLGFLSSNYAFKKKSFALTLIGPVLMVVSGIFVFVVETVYSLGYSDGFSGSAIPAMVLSLVALVMLFKSKSAFVDYNAGSEDNELESPEAPDAESNNVEQPIEEPSA